MSASAARAPSVGRELAVALGLALGPAVAIGLARFSYSLLLPAMRVDLHWSFAQAGAMNTANAAGYLIGALATGPLTVRAGHRRPFVAGVALTGLALLGSAATADFAVLLALRLVTGITGALVFISGAALTARLVGGLTPGRSAALLGAYFAGPAAGIVISALTVPPAIGPGGAWRWGWVVMGAACLVALAGAAPAARRAPSPPPSPAAGLARGLGGWPVRRLAPTVVAYGLFGAGYIAYVTFIVAFLKSEGLGPGAISAFWASLGGAGVAAAFAWAPLLGRLSGGRAPALTLGLVAAGGLLPLIAADPVGAFASAVLFGATFLSVVTAVTTVARRVLSAAQLSPAIAGLTVVFASGQSVGPLLAGVLSDGPAGIRAGLVLSVAIVAAAAAVALAQRAAPTAP